MIAFVQICYQHEVILSPVLRNNVHVQGGGDRAMIFAHGSGCD